MGAIWIWFLIAIIFGVSAGLIFHFALRKVKGKKNPDENSESDVSNNGNILLTIFVFTIIGFLIVWLVWALLGLKMYW